jgi:spatacsin
MECLKKLALVSLQLELAEPPVLRLEKSEAKDLMCKRDFPFALTLAVAYDLDTEEVWAEVIHAQTILKDGDDFVQAFQLFRPLTASLCNRIVKLYLEKGENAAAKRRMAQLVTTFPNLIERYKIAKQLNFTEEMESMKELNPMVCEWCEKALV